LQQPQNPKMGKGPRAQIQKILQLQKFIDIEKGQSPGGFIVYCDYFIWCVSCTVVVLTCFVMCGCVYVWVF
jgi:hypothetical protein